MHKPDIASTWTRIYCVYDIVAKELFGSIIRAANDEVARRSFHDLLSQKDSPISNHRGDYNLLCLAEIDNYGNLELQPNDGAHGPTVIARGQDWLDANKETIA